MNYIYDIKDDYVIKMGNRVVVTHKITTEDHKKHWGDLFLGRWKRAFLIYHLSNEMCHVYGHITDIDIRRI